MNNKYKDCVLPVITEEGIIIEQAYYNQGKIKFEQTQYENIYEPLSDIINYNFYYSYNIKNKHSHNHSIEGVIKELYYNPETFNINKEDEYLYSKQELRYLKRLKNLLQLIGLKDVETYNEEELIKRAQNKKLKQLLEYKQINFNKTAQKIIEGKRKKLITKFINEKNIEKNGKYIILDKDDNYLGLIETTKQKIKLKEITEKIIDYKIQEYKTIEELKNDIKKDFNIDENQYVILETIKEIERFVKNEK